MDRVRVLKIVIIGGKCPVEGCESTWTQHGWSFMECPVHRQLLVRTEFVQERDVTVTQERLLRKAGRVVD